MDNLIHTFQLKLMTLTRQRVPIKFVSGEDLFWLFAYACTQQYYF